jgi:outer membrane protein insertion porin family
MKNRLLSSIFLAAFLYVGVPVGNVSAAPLIQDQDAAAQQQIVENIDFRGNRRIPSDTLRLYVTTKQGDLFSPEQISRDYQAVLAQGYFDPLKCNVTQEPGNTGGVIVVFNLTEYPVIRDIQYEGLKSVQMSDLLMRFKEKRISLTKDSQYDPVVVRRAETELKALLSERGRPDAQVSAEVEDISKTSVVITFNIDEGLRARIVKIDFDGNQVFSDRQLRKAMKLTKQSGLFTRVTSKDVYSPEKFGNDLILIQQFLRDKGYLRPTVGEPQVENIGMVGGGVPIIGKKSRGIKITVPIDEGVRYRFGEITAEGSTIFTPEQVVAISGLKKGDIASAKKIREGVFEQLKKAYGSRGYIQAEANPTPNFKPPVAGEKDGVVDFMISIEEGSVYSVRQLEFVGNNVTRDKVLRREVLVAEGEPYNQSLMDLSVLRLNQLGFFEEIKKEDIQTQTDERNKMVDITVKVKEKGRQQIQFSGGASGIGGSFIGLTYSTNNLFGFGQSISADLQVGNRQRNISLSFTEPFLLDRPIGLGVSVFSQRFDFASNFNGNGGLGIGNNGNLLGGFSGLDENTLFRQTTQGFSVSLTGPFGFFTKRFPTIGRFTRVGVSYGFSSSRIQEPRVNTDGDPNNNIPSIGQGGITSSSVTPSIVYNTVDNPVNPRRGRNISLSFGLAGLGGTVKTVSPSLEFREFRAFNFLARSPEKPAVLAMRFQAQNISSYGGGFDNNSFSFINGVPQFSRFFTGGEFSIRGYNIRSIAPVARLDRFVTTSSPNAIQGVELGTGNVVALSPQTVSRFTFNNLALTGDRQFLNPFPFFPVGGDTNLLLNLEYRIPVVGPVSANLFADAGSAFNIRDIRAQNVVSDAQLTTLNSFDPNFVGISPFGTLQTLPVPIDANGNIAADPNAMGVRFVNILGAVSTRDQVSSLGGNFGGFGRNIRTSVGVELQVDVPVLQVPFRLIFALNPNARTDRFDPTLLSIEQKRVIRFTIGRTF